MVNEIPRFLGYLNELTETILNDQERVRAEWKDQLFGVDLWFGLVEELQRIMAKYPKELYRSANVLADQLFDGYNAMFCVHTLTQYIAQGNHSDPKFRPAVELLFT